MGVRAGLAEEEEPVGLMAPRQHPALRAVSFSTRVAQPHRPELLRVPAPQPGGTCWGLCLSSRNCFL